MQGLPSCILIHAPVCVIIGNDALPDFEWALEAEILPHLVCRVTLYFVLSPLQWGQSIEYFRIRQPSANEIVVSIPDMTISLSTK